MNTEWKKVKIGDIAHFNTNTYSTNEKWGYINYLDTGNITNNKIDSIQYIDILKEKLPSRARRKVKYNSIVYSTVRPNQKHFGIIKEMPDNFIVSTGFTVIDVDCNKANADFIFYYLSQDKIINALHAIAEQSVSAYPSIKSSDLENLEIDCPPLDEQNKIASLLVSLSNKIAVNNQINNNLEELALTYFKKLIPFKVGDKLPLGWQLGKTEDIIEIHDSKRIPLSSSVRDKMINKIYPYYGAASLMDYVDDYIFEGKYLLLGEDGTVIDSTGLPILQYVWGKFWVNNHAHILTGKNGFNVESLYLLFKQTSVKSIVTGAVQPKISQINLKSINVVIPPVSVLDELNTSIEPMFTHIRLNNDENKRLSQLRDLLLPKLMSGELDVSNLES